MRTSFDLLPIVDAFAEAALDSSRWGSAVDALSRQAGSYGACLVPMRGSAPISAFSESLTDVHASYARDGWFRRDQRYKAVPMMASRGVGTDLDFTTPDMMRRDPYYQEWLAPHGLRWFAGVRVAFGPDAWCISIQRTISQGPFDEEAVRSLCLLSASLSSACAVASAMSFARLDGLDAAFSMSRRATVIIDSLGSVVRFNSAAAKLIGNGIDITRGRLRARDQATSRQLNDLIHAALWNTNRVSGPSSILVRRADKRPLIAYVLRAPSRFVDAIGRCAAFVILIDTHEVLEARSDILVAAFDLSPAEVSIAVRIGSGVSVENAATSLAISYETARSHLKRVFQKLGVSRQAELAAILTSIAAQELADDPSHGTHPIG